MQDLSASAIKDYSKWSSETGADYNKVSLKL